MFGFKFVFAAGLMCLALVAVMPIRGENKTWPDYSCHPAFRGSEVAKGAYNYHVMQKKDCADDERRLGPCAKICYMKWNSIMFQYSGGNDPVTFDPDAFADDLAKANQISFYSKAGLGLSLRMEKCKKAHPEIPKMWKHMRSSCEIWEPILTCIDKAICG